MNELDRLNPAGLTSVAQADRMEEDAMDRIKSVQDPAEARELLRQVKLVSAAQELRLLTESREREWHIMSLRAWRRYGELLGPARTGPPSGRRNAAKNNLSGGQVISNAEMTARKKARLVADVDEDDFEDYLTISGRRPTLAGLLNPKSDRPVHELDDQEAAQLDAAIRKRLKAGKPVKRQELQDRFAARQAVVERRIQFVSGQLDAETNGRNRKPGQSKWDGKTNAARERELRARQSNIDQANLYWKLLDSQADISRMCVILEKVQVTDYDLSEIVLAERFADMYDDLVRLGWWLDRQLLAIAKHLNDKDVREKIKKLRDTNGRTPEETETALRLADRLERKLEAITEHGES